MRTTANVSAWFPGGKRKKLVYKYGPYGFLLPAVIFYSVTVTYPILRGFWLSLLDWRIFYPKKFIGLANYEKLFFHDETFLPVLMHNLIYVALTVSIPIILGVIMAASLDGLRHRRLADVLRGLYFIPAILSVIAVGLIWGWFYNPYIGLLNGALRVVSKAAGQIQWLGSQHLALYSIIAARTWMSVGFCMVVFLAGLRGISEDYYEAARIDGASGVKAFFTITLPLLRPSFAVLLLVNTVDAFKEFALIYVMTRGGPAGASDLISTYMYRVGFSAWKISYAASMGVTLFLIILIVTFFLRKVAERFDDL